MASIRPLPAEAVAQIKSSVTITSLVNVIQGLLENALDASAIKVDISIDFTRANCTVQDDGSGIAPADFRKDGGLGRMHHTAKHDRVTSPCHGGQGVFLASLSALSLLSITSKSSHYHSCNSITWHRTRVVARQLPALNHTELSGDPKHGTRVVVRDLFGNNPVRVKQRALSSDVDTAHDKLWKECKTVVHALLLAWPEPVVVHVHDANNASRGYTASSAHLSAFNSGRSSPSTSDKTADVTYMSKLLVSAGSLSPHLLASFVPTSASTPHVSVLGVISTSPTPTKNVQFISLGVRPCLPLHEYSVLYAAVNRLFEKSDFGAESSDESPDEAEQMQRRRDRRLKQDGLTRQRFSGLKKGVDRWPVFYLRIDLNSPSGVLPVDLLDDGHYLQRSTAVLEALTQKWLQAHNLRPAKTQGRTRGQNSEDATSARKQNHSSVAIKPTISRASSSSRPVSSPAPYSNFFSTWTRIKSADPGFFNHKTSVSSRPSTLGNTVTKNADREKDRSPPRQAPCPAPPNVDQPHPDAFPEKCHDDEEPLQPQNAVECSTTIDGARGKPSRKGFVEWQDPVTKEVLLISTRTGAVSSKPGQSAVKPSKRRDVRNPEKVSITTHTTLPFSQSAALHCPDTRVATTWLDGLLRDWSNPQFVRQPEPTVRAIRHDDILRAVGESRKSRGGSRNSRAAGEALGSGVALSKGALGSAKIIAQVDQKYILVSVGADPLSTRGVRDQERCTSTLVLIDQHAASERCILESLMGELCEPSSKPTIKSNLGLHAAINTTALERRLHFEIPLVEHPLFKTHAPYFARWGILYDLTEASPPTSAHAQLVLLTLPSGIAGRCIIEPKVAIKLLRTAVYQRAQGDQTGPRIASVSDDQRTVGSTHIHAWLRSSASCPQGMLDLLSSRACRSAIMFNDKLSIMDCEALVTKLAACAFPFICAHGRVSAVPLLQIDGGVMDFGGTCDRTSGPKSACLPADEQSFVGAFGRWRDKEIQR